MYKIDLSNVTLVCGDSLPEHTKHINNIFSILENRIKFYDMIHYDKHIHSIEEYNMFCASKLDEIVDTDFCMVVQWDGYPINFDAWDPKFLEYDYIGAPWLLQPHALDQTVGNGGFSIRSKAYLENTKMSVVHGDYSGDEPEDVYFCRTKKLDNLDYAPIGVAYEFSVEDMPYKGQFGFHGMSTIQINKGLGIFH